MVTGNSKVSKANGTLSLLLLLALLLFSLVPTEAQIGVTYGQSGDNLPSPQQVVNLYRSNGIRWMRIYYPDPATLQAIRNSGVTLLLDVPNDQIQNFAQNPSAAVQWVKQNVVPYAECISFLAVGNEVTQNIKQYVGPAMTNTLNALNSFGSLTSHIKVTTAIGMSELTNTYPPSNGQFADLPFMDPIVNFLKQNGSPLMLNVYPYFTYIDNKGTVSLDYALFTSPGTVVTDPNNGLHYQNIYDALVDSVYAALAKRDAPNNQGGPPNNSGRGPHTQVITSETGWPSAGGDHGLVRNAGGDSAASVSNAGTYYRNMISHAKVGTPLNPGPSLVFLFSAFDENKKLGDATEQHFGIFNTNGTPKYPGLNFNS
ncbi:glucan endo-1,3-beta-glucosidase-like isoform X1 [Silene latifolia]|uniref:glucan endo-1,3-beta-glucosidase-like isoform X1 n=1 Tax=Silene latifolia TaxID=37657 RepID=UPI003D77EB3C